MIYTARMLAFRVKSQERLVFWIKVFAFQYHYQLGTLDNVVCRWTYKENPKDIIIGEIFIQLFKGSDVDTTVDSNKLLTFHIHVYPSTFLITIQGTHYLSWSTWEFSYLKSILWIINLVPLLH